MQRIAGYPLYTHTHTHTHTHICIYIYIYIYICICICICITGELVVETEDGRIEEAVDGTYKQGNVVNLSDRILISMEINVLSTGLNFCPTPREICLI